MNARNAGTMTLKIQTKLEKENGEYKISFGTSHL